MIGFCCSSITIVIAGISLPFSISSAGNSSRPISTLLIFGHYFIMTTITPRGDDGQDPCARLHAKLRVFCSARMRAAWGPFSEHRPVWEG
jgi:hypothetical protein